jgi:hypothetical protein
VAPDPLHLAVGPDELAVTTLDGPVVEKKVPLPERWLRGFAEVQVIAAAFDLRAELPAAEGLRFLRSLPGGRRQSGALWAVPAGRSLRLASRPASGAVCVPGPQRLEAWAGCCATPAPCGSTGRWSARPARRRPAPGSWCCRACGCS